MTSASLRSLVRWFHIGVALVLGTYIYSPLRIDPLWTDIVRFGVIPLATVTGLCLWKQGRIAKLLRRRSPAERA
ncbi:hypothetical protein [Aureimonas phyllosphaerae]|uniref:Uncharacterized protein n=1 Tax=Aureimonas phyllosphaerae TaxID=1166078 RepID=A0A7W6BYW0_9HYPH|nr:hypothetical protein [Aureimonas phyllosphaerae]MBB3937285.1 hypothetical protein [Aureimonas phyllosphaerae]MBB3961292.1 hypothetical protein [Aureimonas phyllosphaerae]SFF41537.1 hypothetical protein SAMN05216566_1127 [Aureimonas phyllosphaerae]